MPNGTKYPRMRTLCQQLTCRAALEQSLPLGSGGSFRSISQTHPKYTSRLGWAEQLALGRNSP